MKSELEIIVLRGLQASGKSTYAHNWVSENPDWRIRVNRDDVRKMIANKYWGLSRHQEETVTNQLVSSVRSAIAGELSVIVDNTSLRAADVKFWYRLAEELGVKVSVVDMDTPIEVCIARDAVREKSVGEEVIRSYNDRFFRKGKFPPVPVNDTSAPEGKAYVTNPSLPKAVWVDVDGTLAERVHPDAPQPVRGPFEEDRVGEDTIIPHVVDTVRALKAAGYAIVIMSGRSDGCQPETEAWLKKWDIPYDDIFMRRIKIDEGRKDNIVKHDLFWANVAPKYDVHFALDDRQQVVDFTRNILKIPVYQVQPGNF